jgi:uroporphyrinogen decarboxylase
MGYDTVSFEQCITKILPGGGALYAHSEPVIKTRADFEAYPWDELPDTFFGAFEKDYRALAEVMPEGMKAIGGPGNGLFEIVQDLCGYEDLCYISIDDPELYGELFQKAADLMKAIWQRFLKSFSDTYCVCRFGDDLGFNTQTLLPAAHIREHIIPRYREIIELVHSYKKPFLLHSCGHIEAIVPDLIDKVHVDARHSFEDVIVPVEQFKARWGDKLAVLGGVDVDLLSRGTPERIRERTRQILAACAPAASLLK